MGEGFLQTLSNIFGTLIVIMTVSNDYGFLCHVFLQFSGYNRPELSKHRKREFTNLEKSTLRSLSSHLFSCLQDQYWERQNWRALKDDMVTLAQSISGYAEYLDCSNKRSKEVHASPVPVHEIADNMFVTVLPVTFCRPPLLANLISKLEDISDFEYVSVDDFCHLDARKRFEYIHAVKAGLPFKTIFFTYKHGNNIGNLNFIWKVTEDSLSSSQRVIEQLKPQLSLFIIHDS